MKSGKSLVNIICSIIILCILILGTIYLFKTINNQAVIIIGCIIMGILGLCIAIFIVKELCSKEEKSLNNKNESNCKCHSRNLSMSIIYIIISIAIIGACIYFLFNHQG